MLSNSRLSFIVLLLLGFIWGTGYSIARFAMLSGVPPLGYSFWQSLGPAIILGFIIFFSNQPAPLTIKKTFYYFISGLTGIAIPNTTMYFAATHLPASILAIVVNTVPIMAYPMALLAKLEKFTWQRMIGILFAFSGLMLIVFPRSSLPSPTMVPWVGLTLLTPFSFAFCSIYIARYRPPDSDTLLLSAGMLICSSLLLMPVVYLTHSFYYFHFPFTITDWIIVLEIILSSLGYLLFFYLIKIAGPVYYSLVDTIVVLIGIFWGYVIFDERLHMWSLVAVCLIVVALMLVTQYQRAATSEKELT